MSSFLGGGGSGGGGGGSPGGSNTDIQFNNSGSFGGDANFTWTIGTGEINLLNYALGNFGQIGTQTFAPGDPVNAVTETDEAIFSENAHIVGDLSIYYLAALGVTVNNGYKHTGTNLGYINDINITPTLNSDTTGPVDQFYAMFIGPTNYSTAGLSDLRNIVTNSNNNVAQNLDTLFSSVYDVSYVQSSGNITYWRSFFTETTFQGTGTVTTFDSFASNPLVTGGGTIINLVDFHAYSIQGSFTGTITNYIGLEIEDHSGVGGTLSLNMWSKGNASLNQFDGNINVGGAGGTPAYKYDSLNAMFSVPAGGAGVGASWFLGGAGNFTTTGFANFCEGPGAGGSLTTGFWNMAEGSGALASVTTGSGNVGLGRFAANALVDGHDNVALGSGALQGFTTGCNFNMAIGVGALGSGVGVNCVSNVAIGNTAGGSINTGSSNVFIGDGAAQHATSAALNVCIGAQSSQALNTGQFNIILGYNNAQSYDSNFSIIMGFDTANVLTAGFNTIIGTLAGSLGTALTSAQQCILIGYGTGVPSASASGQISIGNMFYGANCSGTGSTPSTGQAGIGIPSPTATLHLAPSTTAQANLRFDPTSAAAPTSPNDGDMWYDGTNLKFRQGGTTHTIV